MNKLWRVVDAEYNRVSEGLRVLEDLARFYWETDTLTARLKALRSRLAGLTAKFRAECIRNRDAAGDIGLEISRKLRLDSRNGVGELAGANFKRVQEGLRSLEEHLKTLDDYPAAKEMEQLRFQTYTLEKDLHDLLGRNRLIRFWDNGLYGITAAEYSLGRSGPEVVRQMLTAGIKIIQYREKKLKAAEQYRECLEIRKLTSDFGACFIVNDHIDLALAVRADGVHIGQEDLPVEVVRRLTGGTMLIGVSTHSPEQADAAVQAGADYIGVGPIFATATKEDVCPPVSLDYLDYVVARHRIPHVAIGGIKQSNLAEVVRHGARCVAMVTEIVGAPDIGAKIRALQDEMKYAKERIQ